MPNRPFALRRLKAQFRFLPITWSRLFSILLTCVGGGMAVWFFVKERGELRELRHYLGMASPAWVLAGMALTGLYILLQGLMYQHTLRAAGARALLSDTTRLYLKRNFVSPFLPAGGMVSLGMFGEPLQKRGVAPTALHFATSLYALVGLASLGAISVPVLLYLLWQKKLSGGETLGFLWVLIMLVVIGVLIGSLKNGGKAAQFLLKKAPGLEVILTELRSHPLVAREVLKSLAASFGIEAVGMLHLWMAMQTLGLNTNWKAAAVSYVVSILVMTVSPFLRGLGAVELAMAFVLAQFGMAPIEAMATTLLFRFFEFWLVLLAGLGAFLQSLVGRVLPPSFLFALGLANIV